MLIDTDIIIWYTKANENAVQLLDSNVGFKVSCVTYMELIQNARDKNEIKKIHQALKYWKAEVIYLNEKISMLASLHVEKYCLSHSHELGDALIAATAIVHNLELNSGNKKHFSFLKDLNFRQFKASAQKN